MLRKSDQKIEWLEFEIFADFPRLAHKIFLRHGGFSAQCFSSLNLGFHCGDKYDAVKGNRLIAGIDQYVGGLHIHGVQVSEVTDAITAEIPNCDALMTDIPGIGLLTTHADCQSALFYDPIHHAIANVHCGWRGNVQNIYEITIGKLKKRYGSKPENLLVGIGPSLGPYHAQFINYRTEFPSTFWDFQVKETYFDLWEIARMQLKKAGVLDQHIEIARMCTFTEEADFFSYRRDKLCGRHATVIELDQSF